MCTTRSIGSTNNLSNPLIDYYLSFESMAFFLAAIVATLFFLGTFNRSFRHIYYKYLPLLAGQPHKKDAVGWDKVKQVGTLQ